MHQSKEWRWRKLALQQMRWLWYIKKSGESPLPDKIDHQFADLLQIHKKTWSVLPQLEKTINYNK